jgi:hypothetical protein
MFPGGSELNIGKTIAAFSGRPQVQLQSSIE